MTHHITSDLVIACSQCQRKASLLLGGQIEEAQHEYQCILEERAAANRSRYISTLPNGQVDSLLRKNGGVRFSRKDNPSCTISVDDLIATCDALFKPKRKSASSPTRLQPHLVVGTHSVTDDQKLRLAFAGYVVGQTTRYRPSIGLIVPITERPRQIRLEPLYTRIYKIINDLREQIRKPLSEPPAPCLNKHCATCQFRAHCMHEAEKTDSLSLLERITPKLIQRYQKKGIFTVMQLSYVYKPRRRRKKSADTPPSFNLELQALAIRTNKIYLHETPTISRQPIELFLDVEGIPDQNFDYLIGLLIRNGNDVSYHSFWADSIEDEPKIFEAYLQKTAVYENAPIYHYGNYEPRAFQQASKKHGIDFEAVINKMVNVNSFVFGKVYFPTRSNRLKDLGACVGASWSEPDPSGLKSLVWRYRWEQHSEMEYKDLLLTYNHEDCDAVRLLVRELQDLTDAAASRSDVDFADRPKQESTRLGDEIHRVFDGILISAHNAYQRKRIHHCSEKKSRKTGTKYATHHCHPHTINQLNTSRKVGRTIHVPRKRKCPRHPKHDLKLSAEVAEHLLIDLVFTKNGCRKIIVKHVGKRAYCPLCDFAYLPPGVKRLRSRIYGHGFQSWAVYQRVVLRLPYPVISQSIRDQLSEHVNTSTICDFVPQFAREYAKTERALLKRIIEGPIIHVDETKINIKGMNNYVWTLTNGTYVVFQLTETRETTFLRKILRGYEGVLTSDFYSGYDSIDCRQQKCLGHLIRDLNDDLWKNPFNQEYESFLVSVKELLVPIFKDEERYGLKARFLKKHVKAVIRFYKLNIDGRQHECDIVQKYQKRFARYRESLFRFLIEDGIPWNNNMAERALRHVAIQRKISGSFFKSEATNYLKLLGIAQTCRFQDKSFLKFLLSGERDIDNYKERGRRKSSKY